MSGKGNTKNRSTTKKSKKKLHVPFVIVHVKATFNNTIVSVTDPSGNLIVAWSAGREGFRGKERSSSYAGAKVAEKAVLEAQRCANCSSCDVILKGAGPGRESAARGVARAGGMKINMICDRTPLPHNGCRPRKRRTP